MGMPALLSAFIKISFSSWICHEPLFAVQEAVRANRDWIVSRFWWNSAIPRFPMVRFRKSSWITFCSNQVDANTAQCYEKLKINFHFALSKSLLTRIIKSWKEFVYMLRLRSLSTSILPILKLIKAKKELLRWTFSCAAINLVTTSFFKSKNCGLPSTSLSFL